MTVTIYHNPRCSKSRQTLEIIRAQNIEPVIVEYLKDVPTAHTIGSLLDMLELKPRELMRKGEAEYKDNNLADKNLSWAELINAMVEFPKLIERPIVVHNAKAIIGRPPEKVLEIL